MNPHYGGQSEKKMLKGLGKMYRRYDKGSNIGDEWPQKKIPDQKVMPLGIARLYPPRKLVVRNRQIAAIF